jgi:hypothetical protein
MFRRKTGMIPLFGFPGPFSQYIPDHASGYAGGRREVNLFHLPSVIQEPFHVRPLVCLGESLAVHVIRCHPKYPGILGSSLVHRAWNRPSFRSDRGQQSGEPVRDKVIRPVMKHFQRREFPIGFRGLDLFGIILDNILVDLESALGISVDSE